MQGTWASAPQVSRLRRVDTHIDSLPEWEENWPPGPIAIDFGFLADK